MSFSSGFSAVHKALEADFIERLPRYHKFQHEALTLLSGIMLDVRSANLMDLSASLPSNIGTIGHRYQYVSPV